MLSGCLNDFDDQGHVLSIHAIDVAAPVVRSGTIDLVVTVTIDNAGGRSGDVALHVKAVRTDTGLLEDETTHAIGMLPKDTTQPTEVGFTLPRDTGYRFDVALLEDGQISRSRAVTVGHLGGLPANLHETGMQVAAMDFLIESVGERVTVQADIYLTNEGSEASKAIRMQVKARDLATSLLADIVWVDLASAPPEETHRHPVSLDVPAQRNYEMEAVLWDGDFIVGRGIGYVQLLPTIQVPKGEEIVVQAPNLDDFVRHNLDYGADSESKSTPGVALPLLLLGLLAVTLWRRT